MSAYAIWRPELRMLYNDMAMLPACSYPTACLQAVAMEALKPRSQDNINTKITIVIMLLVMRIDYRTRWRLVRQDAQLIQKMLLNK